MKTKVLKKLNAGKVTIFKIKNRKGYAAISLNNLTEGRTPAQAMSRLAHPLKRLGYELPTRVPKPKKNI